MILFIKKYWLILTLILAIIIATLSLTPLEKLPEVAGSDKTHHLVAYFALACPLAIAKPKNWVVYMVVMVLFGGMIELIQPYINRYGEWLDFLANVTGLICGLMFGTAVRFIYKKINLNCAKI